MGIDIRAKLLYGAQYEEIDLEDLDDLIDEGTLDKASPYYDAGRDECFIGVAIGNTHEDLGHLAKAVADAKEEWERITNGAPGYIKCCKHVF